MKTSHHQELSARGGHGHVKPVVVTFIFIAYHTRETTLSYHRVNSLYKYQEPPEPMLAKQKKAKNAGETRIWDGNVPPQQQRARN